MPPFTRKLLRKFRYRFRAIFCPITGIQRDPRALILIHYRTTFSRGIRWKWFQGATYPICPCKKRFVIFHTQIYSNRHISVNLRPSGLILSPIERAWANWGGSPNKLFLKDASFDAKIAPEVSVSISSYILANNWHSKGSTSFDFDTLSDYFLTKNLMEVVSKSHFPIFSCKKRFVIFHTQSLAVRSACHLYTLLTQGKVHRYWLSR